MNKELPVWEDHNCPVCGKCVYINHIQKDVYIIGCYNQECAVQPFGFGKTLRDTEVDYDVKSTDMSMLICAIREGKYSV